MNRLDEIAARLAAIAQEVETAEGDALAALNSEVDALTEERTRLQNEVQTRAALRGRIAAGTEPGIQTTMPSTQEPNTEERIASELVKTNRMTVDASQARSVLVSGGTIATPTQVSGINDLKGAKYSSILDMVKVVNCEGMSTNRVAYIAADASPASVQTEGAAPTDGSGNLALNEPTFGYVDITPTSCVVISQISKQAKKQTPLDYKAKVTEQAFIALRKKAAELVTAKLKASALNAKVDAELTGSAGSKTGVITENTLRKLVLNYGGDEGIGAGVLFLNKTDLLAFGDVRGTNEKKPIYKITPDTDNPNTGIIEEGGLAVRYCICSGLTACHGTAQAAANGADKVTMIYGDPKSLELDLFSNYEIRVSEDFAFSALMDTIRGDVELGADVVVKNGFVALVIKKAAS